MTAVDSGAPAPAGDQPLRVGTKAAFGIGSAAEAIALVSLGAYALFFYNQVLGLPAGMAGLAISVSLVFDGLADPVIGSLSDRTHSKLGRRHPYMYGAPIFIAISFFAIFNPPSGLSHWALFAWFTVSVTVLRIAMGFFHTPHLALGGELSRSYVERSQVMAWNSISGWAGGTAISLIALSFFFTATPQYPRGLLNPAPYMPFALFAAVTTMVILFASSWFTRDQIPRLPKPPPNLPKFSPFEFLSDISKVLRNRNYVWLLLGLFFLSLMNGVREALNLYVATYFWEFTSEQLRWYAVGSTIGFFSAFFFTPLGHHLWNKRLVIILSAIASGVFPALGVILRLSGMMFENGHPLLLPTLIAISVVSYGTGAILNISVMSALADVADENEARFGVRQEGVLYATRALFAKIDAAIGTLLAGLVLQVIAFPERAQPGAVPADVLERLVWVQGPLSLLPGLLAVVFYGQFSITRSKHAETRARIQEMQAQTTPAGG